MAADRRSVRVFVSSTFRDMMEDRDELMTHAWPELRRFCRERQVELVEVDLRWGISEEQSTRKETLRLCLDEIHACRPFFIGLLGERYGWVPGPDAFTRDLLEEQAWLSALDRDKSVTELEILHGVLNNPQEAKGAFFYFRDPAYTEGRGADFHPEGAEAAAKQTSLKAHIRTACAGYGIPLREGYRDPRKLAEMVLEDLKVAIEVQFPIEEIPDPLTREARDHEAFAETRRRTYIGRDDYFQALDGHAAGDGGPLVLLGESGGGKSALLANWVAQWRQDHPRDFIIQHYIGGTHDSADHWRLMTRLMAEIKRWTGEDEELPHSHDDILKVFPVWLAKARIKAQRDGVRCILVLDALNQLEDHDHARLLGWLPSHPFTGPLRLMVSTLPGDTLEAIEKRGWANPLRIQPLTTEERGRMIAHYLRRFGKVLGDAWVELIAAVPAAANPLYMRILLDELRVTGTHDKLGERLQEYLAEGDIPALLGNVLGRYQRDYDRDRPGLVSETLGLIWAARRGLSESEVLRLLRPQDLPQLPLATWSPLRAALEEGLVDRGGILNFAHDFLRAAVKTAFVPDEATAMELRLRLADDFEAQPVSARSCDELPWVLWQAEARDRLRAPLLDIERFLEIHKRDQEELMRFWVWLGEERTMGKPYLAAFEAWSGQPGHQDALRSRVANQLGYFLDAAALHAEAELLCRRSLAIEQSFGTDRPDVASTLISLAHLLRATNRMAEAEPLMRRALAIDEHCFGPDHPNVARDLNHLAGLLQATNRLAEAEPLMRRALAIDEESFGVDHPKVAGPLSNLAQLLQDTNRLAEAEPLMRRALAIDEQSFGADHPIVAIGLNNLALLLKDTNRVAEAEPLMRRALAIDEQSFGPTHPNVAFRLNNLALLLQATNRLTDAERLMRRALTVDEQTLGPDHPNVSRDLNNLAVLLQETNRLAEAEPLMQRALVIEERSFGPVHPNVAIRLNNLAAFLQDTNRLAEAEPLVRRALAIKEDSFGPDHPHVARDLNNLANILFATNRQAEAEPLSRRMVEMLLKTTLANGHPHPNLKAAVCNYAGMLLAMGRSEEMVQAQINMILRRYGLRPIDPNSQ